VPRPRLHLIRFHGVLLPNAKLRSEIIASPVEQATEPACDHAQAQGAPARMSWARLLKRVFNIDIDLIDLRSPQEMPALYPRHCGRASADQIRKA
jgi:hypothetical protein